MNLSTLVRRISLIVACVASLAAAEERFITRWQLSENQLHIDRGGRVNSIAVHPTNSNQMFVASETGGLFKTANGGQSWTHVPFKDLPVIFTQSVVYLPWNANTLLVTAKADFKTNNGGGLWRSLNGGQSWHPIPLAQSIPNFTGRLSGYGISADNGNLKLVVGTSEGIFWSTDAQAASWNYSNVFSSGNKTVYSVLGVNGNPARIHAGGPAGVRFTTLPNISWQQAGTPPGAPGDAAVLDIHAFGRAPLSSQHQQTFVVNRRAELFRTGDGGVTWRRIVAPTGGPGCGGSAFIRVAHKSINATNSLYLYLGNRCGLHRLEARLNDELADYSGTWRPAEHDGNPRDLALFLGDAVLLGSNFGLHKTVTNVQQGLIWTLAGNGRSGGYNALQIAEVDGQRIQKEGHRVTDLYVATQDNNLWAATVNGAVFPNHHVGSACFIEGPRDVASESEAVFTFAPGNYPPQFAERNLREIDDWSPPAGAAGKPAYIGHGDWVQQVAPGTFQAGLALKEHAGAPWRQYAVYSVEPRDIPKLGRQGSLAVPRHPSVVYQAYKGRGGFGRDPRGNRLMRILRDLDSNGNAHVFYPLMDGFGSLGINPTMFAWYQVFGVDPSRAFHLIAPDVLGKNGEEETRQVKKSTTGGETWEVIEGLKELVTVREDGTTLLFRTDLSGRGLGEVFPIVTAVSYFPGDSRLVLLGTSEGGIYFSNDYGNSGSWKRIPDSGEATYITSFFWEHANSVFVSTYGRGLWKLTNRRIAVAEIFDDLCRGCEVLSADGGPDRPQFEGSVIAFDGSMLGVRTENGQVREVFVTPGTSVVFTGDPNDPQDDITVTESDGRDTSKLAELPKPPADGWILTGVVFTKGDGLAGAAYAESEISLVPPVGDEDVKGSTVSPTEGQPYIRLSSANFNGVATAAPGETFALAATGFAAGAKYEVLVDGEPLKDGVTADGSGSFETRIAAPAEPGYHRVEVRAAGGGEVIDGSEVVVRP